MIEKYFLNLAGEYRVSAELLLRGLFATVTLGHMKGADVVAVGPNRRAAVIEVKASNSSRIVTRFFQKYQTPDAVHPTFWVLYTVRADGFGFAERFFVLTHGELAERQGLRNRRGKHHTFEEYASLSKGGVDNVDVKDVVEFEDRWDKIIEYCSIECAGTRDVRRRRSAGKR